VTDLGTTVSFYPFFPLTDQPLLSFHGSNSTVTAVTSYNFRYVLQNVVLSLGWSWVNLTITVTLNLSINIILQ